VRSRRVPHSSGIIKSNTHLGGLRDGDWFTLGNIDFGHQWQSAVARYASSVKGLNTDRTLRAPPRHHRATDPLVMEAIRNDGMDERIRQQWTFLYNIMDGAWLRFEKVPLGQGYRHFYVVYGNDRHGPHLLEIHLDRPDGPLAGRIVLPQTDTPRGGRIQIYAQTVGDVTVDALGTRDVYLVFHAPDGAPVGEFEYFRFEQYRGQIGLAKNEVKLELHIDGPDGEKIGEFYPHFTGAPATFRAAVTPLQPVTGTHALAVVVRSAVPGPIGAIDWLSLEKAKRPIDPTGIEQTPRTVRGKPVFPTPTNVPGALPADRYAKRVTAHPQPFFAATRCAQPSAIDGRVDPWMTERRALLLQESWDGRASTEPPGRAWIGYDPQALYIAVRTPIAGPRDLTYQPHRWGVSPGGETRAEMAAMPISRRPIIGRCSWLAACMANRRSSFARNRARACCCPIWRMRKRP